MQNKNGCGRSLYQPRERITKRKLWWGFYRSVPERVTHLDHKTLDHTVDDRVVVIVVLRVATEVLHLVRGHRFSVIGLRISSAVGLLAHETVTEGL